MYGKILVPMDGSDTSTCGLNEAIQIAKNLGGRIRVVHVVNEFIIDGTFSRGMYMNDLFQSLRDTGKTILAQAEALVRQSGIEVDSVLVESIGGPAADFIVAQAKQWPADLIVMGTHGRRGLARLTMGSDAEQVVRAISVPILLVRSAPQRRKPASQGTSIGVSA